MSVDRKKFIGQIAAGIGLSSLPANLLANEDSFDIDFLREPADAEDEKYWRKFARDFYNVAADYTNLENGYFGVQSKPVLQAYQKATAFVNSDLARYARKGYPEVSSKAKKRLAEFLHVSHEEIMFTRNATEALNIAIQGYPFNTGDEVLLTQLDYFSMIECFRMLEKRGQIKVKTFDLPLLPNSEEEIVNAYRNAIGPQTKMILLTHVSNINGLLLPVKKITAMAREKGIDTITDSAHALGQVPFELSELGSDIVGMNLHKWIGNPIGLGLLYIKKERIPSMKPFFGDVNTAEDSIDKLAHIGTTNLAATMTLPHSLAFHEMVETKKINSRLHYLKKIWMKEFKNDPKVELVTPIDMSCAIASFRIRERKSSEVADYLFKEHKILTVARALDKNGCVRVTPSLYNSKDDMLKLVGAIRAFNG